ncbi:MAG: hypothetical protein ACJAS1_002934 [Oleiphilaceae bacterium]|jgi:hypothetical protein
MVRLMIVSLNKQLLQFKSVFLLSLLLSVSFNGSAKIQTIPDELYNGIIQFELYSGRYFDALVLMDESYQKSHLVDYLTALQGFNITRDLPQLIKKVKKNKGLNDSDYYKVGRIEYFQENCLPALKAFKKIQNNSSLDEKEPWSFYRANCFIKLGSNVRAGQALNDVLGGIWAAYAYYNLAISYAETSRDNTRALGALYIAESLNTGQSKEAKSLSDRINLVAGKLYLDAKKYDSAIQFFKKVHLDSESTPAGLYLTGLAYLESGDFRAATQTWHSLKTYPIVNQNVAEGYLAIPFAFERSGYISQTIESYLDASNTFEAELEKITKIDALLVKHGAAKIFIEDSTLEGLEWFLAKDVIKNTMRAVYYQYLMQNEALYDQVRLYSELKMLLNSLEFWTSQLVVFDESLSKKKKSFKQERSMFDAPNVLSKINVQKSKIDTVVSQPGMTSSLSSNLQLDVLKNSIEVLKIRLVSLQEKVQKGEALLNKQLNESKALNQTIQNIQKRLSLLISKLDDELTKSLRKRLSTLKSTMISNFERSEQGRIHLFEDMAESKQMKKRNLLDGRYQ